MKWIALAIVVLAIAVFGAAVVIAHDDDPRCTNSSSPFQPNDC